MFLWKGSSQQTQPDDDQEDAPIIDPALLTDSHIENMEITEEDLNDPELLSELNELENSLGTDHNPRLDPNNRISQTQKKPQSPNQQNLPAQQKQPTPRTLR
eukprot:TRINITY_DN2611_c0_g2_i1.p1 TRINITY_DN2611_c0_g2~~TRINITY_DN2611_c0_g2_i1.p1  ORF type:complete len:102 (-),score=33.36 TRINITY_DN2611_c0_g2_i1:3-308(-)